MSRRKARYDWSVALPRKLLATLGVAFCASACAYKPLTGSSIGYKLSGSLKSRAAAAGEANILVQGWLLREAGVRRDNLFVVATARNPGGDEEVVVVMPVGENGQYTMFLPAAEYQLAVYLDADENQVIEPQERYGSRREILKVRANGPSALFGIDIPVSAKPEEEDASFFFEKQSIEELVAPDLKVGESLLSPRYDESVGTLGMIQPNQFLREVQALQFIEEPDFTDSRIPIVFVHGIDGTPQVFERVDEELDHNRFQPWYFYFPSGARLPTCAALLYQDFLSGEVLPRMPQTVVTAHSMGGLVARGALNLEKAAHLLTNVPLYVSFVTPYGGVEEANIGIWNSPFRVPSWVDVASGSEYQGTLFSGLPPGTAFHLIAGNSEGESDGTIRLSSQLFKPAVSEATSTATFPQSHMGIMSARDALAWYKKQLTPVGKRVPVQIAPLPGERERRARVVFDALESALLAQGIQVRTSRVTATYQRWTIVRGAGKVVLQLAVGQGIRADIVRPGYQSFTAPWPLADDADVSAPAQEDGPALGLLPDQDQEVERLRQHEFIADLVQQLLSSLDAAPSDAVATRPPPPLPVAPFQQSTTPPPVHLFLGASGTVNFGQQYLSLRVPAEFAMYFGWLGFGTDLRLPLLSPVIEAESNDLYFLPLGIGIGPRARFGSRDSFLVGGLGANFTTEFGPVQMTEAGSGRPRTNDDAIDETWIGSVGAYGSGNFGFRLAPDFYLRFGADAGSLFTPLKVNIDGEEVTLLEPFFFDVLGGVEIRIP